MTAPTPATAAPARARGTPTTAPAPEAEIPTPTPTRARPAVKVTALFCWAALRLTLAFCRSSNADRIWSWVLTTCRCPQVSNPCPVVQEQDQLVLAQVPSPSKCLGCLKQLEVNLGAQSRQAVM